MYVILPPSLPLHRCMALHAATGIVVSADSRGLLEYWDSNTGEQPTGHVAFRFKSDTGLYDLAKVR